MKFHIVNIYYISICVIFIVCLWINYVHSPDGELSAGVSGNN